MIGAVRTALLLLVVSPAALAQGVAPADDKAAVGNARIVDNDILEVSGQRFHLFGIDAPEQEQSCFLNGRPWTCGAVAYREMEKILFEEGGQVVCTLRDAIDTKRPAARFATCVINGKDIADLMVRRGMAAAQPAQSKDYLEAEKAAERAGIGIWQGPFIPPWEYRERPR